MNPPKALNSRKAAEIIGVTPETLCRMRAQGRGPVYVRDGLLVRYTPSAIEAYLTSGDVDPRCRGNLGGRR